MKNIYGSQHSPVDGNKTGIDWKEWFWNFVRGAKLQPKHSSEGGDVNFDMVRGHSGPSPLLVKNMTLKKVPVH